MEHLPQFAGVLDPYRIGKSRLERIDPFVPATANAHATAGQFQTANNAVGQNTAQQRSKVPLEHFNISLEAGGRTFKLCHPNQVHVVKCPIAPNASVFNTFKALGFRYPKALKF